MVRKLNPADAQISAEIHREGMPDDFLASLGMDFLIQLHRLLIKSPYSICLGYYIDKKPVGIIIGTVNINKAYKQVLLSGFLKLIPPVIKEIIRKPYVIKRIIDAILYPNSDKNQKISAEILILSVDRNFRRRGTGIKLIQSFMKEIKSNQIINFKVSTKKCNLAANAFYKKTGGKFQKEIPIFNTIWNEYYYFL